MPTDRLTSTDCDVAARLEKFDPYRHRLLAWTVYWSPRIILLAVFTRWLVGIPEIAQHHVGVDLLRTLAGEFTEMEPSAWLAVAIAILLLGRLVHRVPATLGMLYLSGVVGLPDREVVKAERDTPPCPPGKGLTPEEEQERDCLFARYVASFQDRLNWVPGSWGFGLAFVLLEFVVIYGAWVNGNKAQYQATNPFWAARGVFDWISFRTFFEYLSNLMPLPMLQTGLVGLVLPLIAGLLLGFLA